MTPTRRDAWQECCPGQATASSRTGDTAATSARGSPGPVARPGPDMGAGGPDGPFMLIEATPATTTTIRLTFSEPVDPATAERPERYGLPAPRARWD